MNLQTIIFDFGNVVGFFNHRKASERLAAHSPLTIDEIHLRIFGGTLEDDFESGRITTPQFLRTVHDVCRLRCREELTAGAFADIFWPNERVCALVPRLKPRYRLLLASNTNDLHAIQFVLQFAPTLAHFDGLVLSHQVGVRKPHAGFYDYCQRLAQCEPNECLFIDDLAPNIAGARAYGWQGMVYQVEDNLSQQLAAFGVEVPSAEPTVHFVPPR